MSSKGSRGGDKQEGLPENKDMKRMTARSKWEVVRNTNTRTRLVIDIIR